MAVNSIDKHPSHGGTDRPGLSYLESLPPWNGQGGFGLSSIVSVLADLGSPQDSFKSIHVAGTNGKGSVSAMTASVLGCAGYKVGMTVSPHLQRINERIVIDGSSIGDLEFDRVLSSVDAATKRVGVHLSYFEAVTAAAFLFFAESSVDYAIVEVGLGGRLDATNVIKRPEVCAIVSIDLDHEYILGNTLEEIAREKAGILKPGVPAVVGRMLDGPRLAIEGCAANVGAPVYRSGFEFNFEPTDAGLVFEHHGHKQADLLSLKGGHQANNAAVVEMIASLLSVPEGSIKAGISNTYWPGRLERLDSFGRKIIMDCGHNPAGLATVISFLDREGIVPDVAFAALQTKQWHKMIDMLKPHVHDWSVLDAVSDSTVPSGELAEYLSCIGVSAKAYGSDYESLIAHEIHGRAGERPLLIVGSMYMLGEMRARLGLEEKPIWKRRV